MVCRGGAPAQNCWVLAAEGRRRIVQNCKMMLQLDDGESLKYCEKDYALLNCGYIDFEIDGLRKMFPKGQDKAYNAVIILNRMIYDGETREFQNETFSCF